MLRADLYRGGALTWQDPQLAQDCKEGEEGWGEQAVGDHQETLQHMDCLSHAFKMGLTLKFTQFLSHSTFHPSSTLYPKSTIPFPIKYCKILPSTLNLKFESPHPKQSG